MALTILTLLLVYQLKHFLADFPLQRHWMLGKFKATGWVAPLAAHAGVHGGLSFLIVLAYSRSLFLAFLLATFDFVVHFTMDRVKASPKLMGRWHALSAAEFRMAKMWVDGTTGVHDCGEAHGECSTKRAADRLAIRGNTLFWWALGFDQMIHHVTHYIIIYQLATIG